MNDDTLIRVEGVSKKFCRSLRKSLWYGMQDLGRELRGRRHGGNGALRPEEFWAVKDISVEVKRGECLGLIGRNGAGKTTLLRMLNGLIKPDGGRIEIRGRVGAIIALGAGFNPVLTGRENIYVNAAVLGLSKREVKRNIGDIIEFAEIGDFIDMPVQSYSSGMSVRLGFAVASSLKPDILMLDEVLAVGDVSFRTKCYNRIYDLASQTAVIFVSHNMSQIARLATSVACLEDGQIAYYGAADLGINRYNNSFKATPPAWQIADGVRVSDIRLNNRPPESTSLSLSGSDPLSVSLVAQFPDEVRGLEVALTISSPAQDVIAQLNNRFNKQIIQNYFGPQLIKIDVPKLCLGSGVSTLSLSIVNAESNEILFWAPATWKLNVTNSPYVPTPSFLVGQITSYPAPG
jgi:lipopolysaccharide transport system ATP-binding protein